jgi:hypothetical protein
MAVNGLFGLRVTSFTGGKVREMCQVPWQRERAKRVTSIVIIAASRNQTATTSDNGEAPRMEH